MSQTSFDTWVYDQLEPDQKLLGDYKRPTVKPTWKIKIDSLEQYPPREELTDEEKNIKSDEYLLKHGIK
jgi:hypothetical protein